MGEVSFVAVTMEHLLAPKAVRRGASPVASLLIVAQRVLEHHAVPEFAVCLAVGLVAVASVVAVNVAVALVEVALVVVASGGSGGSAASVKVAFVEEELLLGLEVAAWLVAKTLDCLLVLLDFFRHRRQDPNLELSIVTFQIVLPMLSMQRVLSL